MSRNPIRRLFRVSVRLMLAITLLVAFFFFGWSSHHRYLHDAYERDRFRAKQIQEHWFAQQEMIRRETSRRSIPATDVEASRRILERAEAENATSSAGQGERP